MLIKIEKKLSPFWLFDKKLIPLHPRMLFVKFGRNWRSGYGEQDFKISSMYFIFFVIIFHLEIGMTLNLKKLKKLELSSTKDALRKFGWNWPTDSGEKDFLILVLSMYFCYFVIISIWKSSWPFIWTNLNSIHPRWFVLSLVEIGLQWFWWKIWIRLNYSSDRKFKVNSNGGPQVFSDCLAKQRTYKNHLQDHWANCNRMWHPET